MAHGSNAMTMLCADEIIPTVGLGSVSLYVFIILSCVYWVCFVLRAFDSFA